MRRARGRASLDPDALPERSMTINRNQRLFLLLFLLPGMTYLIVMRIVPALFTFALSLTNWDLTARGGPRFIGLQNYADILTDQAFQIGRASCRDRGCTYL